MAPQSGNFLKPHEKEWQEVFNRLSERFPTVPGHRVAQALREHHGHAGEAAAVLRDLTSCVVKEADPDDVEHVSTLLSSPAMFKHACKEQFRKFDVNKDGVLEWDEVKQLTNNLYEEFGLQLPSEGSLKAFFYATDENMDGVLSEREFRKFFEMFLRYAFFDHLKLRQMVEKGQEIEKRRSSVNTTDVPKVSEVKADTTDAVSSQGSRASSASETSKPNKPPTPDETQAPPPQKSQSKPELRLAPIEQQKERRRSPQSDQDKQNDRGHQRDREHRSSRDKDRERNQQSDANEGPFGSAVRCLASNGVAYRASPAFQDRMDAVVARGETVRVLEHWVRTPDGWLPVMDPQFQPLFERSNADPGDGGRNSNDNQKKRVSIREQRDDTLDVNVRSATATQKSSKPPEAFGAATVAPRANHEAEGGGLKSNEEEWRPVFDRLKERFPGISEDKIAQALRDNDGHAGKAASMLRYM